MKQSLPTYKHNLETFISQLRDYLLLSQDDLAAHFHLDRTRISRYENERAKDRPRLGYIAGLASLIAERADNEAEVQAELLRQVNEVIRHHFKNRFQTWADLLQEAERYLAKQRAKSNHNHQEKTKWQLELEKRLDLPPAVKLVGVKNYLSQLKNVISSPNAPWVVCIDGMGGIGKTSLANALVRQPALAKQFAGVAWVSAKKQSYVPGGGIVQSTTEPVLSVEALVDNLLSQLDSTLSLTYSAPQKKAALTELLKQTPYLIAVDNLETVDDYQALLPTLLKLTNPSKVLLTSRVSLRTHTDVFTLTLDELDRPKAIQLIKYEAKTRNQAIILTAPESYFDDIYEVIGGNPLALKLIVGQMSVLALDQVLDNLKQAQGKEMQELYNFLYWQAWHLLSLTSQQVFLAMPLTALGTIEQLSAITRLNSYEVSQALQQLAELSLVQIRGDDLNERRYSVHSLTETFLLSEAIKWNKSA